MSINKSSNQIIEPFKVYIRVRPFLQKELIAYAKKQGYDPNSTDEEPPVPQNIFITEETSITIIDRPEDGRRGRDFCFDKIFNEKDRNNDVFETAVKPTLKNLIKGYNTTTLAYGVTGTGKTHTVFGDLSCTEGDKGLVINASDYLFELINEEREKTNKSMNIKMSYMEIYNESVIDLLNPKHSSLMIVEDPKRGVIVPDIKEFIINNSKDLSKLIQEGNKRRTMAPTTQNEFSSRSHALLQITLEQKSAPGDFKQEIIYSKFLIVDLAGSERGGFERGIRREEGANINKSLLSLGTCINLLSDKSKQGAFIPYRNSKLTRLLKDSLGGNILTVFIACVSPNPMTYDESMNTLNYALRARKIKKKVVQNIKEVYSIDQYKEMVESLKSEIFNLKGIIKNQQEKLLENKPIGNNVDVDDFLEKDNFNISEIEFANQSMVSYNIFENQNQEINNNIQENEKNNEIDFQIIQNPQIQINQHLKNKKDLLSMPNLNNIQEGKYVYNGFLMKEKKEYINGRATLKLNLKNKLNIDDFNVVTNDLVSPKNHFGENKENLSFSKTLKTAQNLSVDIYKKLIEKVKQDEANERINDLEAQVENLKNDKLILESCLERQKVKDKEIEEKYASLKYYYEKYIELINDKLIANIDERIVLKYNLKEINELNESNKRNLELLEKQINYYKNSNGAVQPQNIKNYNNLCEEITNINNAIIENEKLKEKIEESAERNFNIKKILKKILLNLLTSSKESGMKYLNVLKEKDELIENQKNYEKRIQKIMSEKQDQNKKLTKAQEELQELKKKLIEKDRKISELEKSNMDLSSNLSMISSNRNFRHDGNIKKNKSFYTKNVANSISSDGMIKKPIKRNRSSKNIVTTSNNQKKYGNKTNNLRSNNTSKMRTKSTNPINKKLYIDKNISSKRNAHNGSTSTSKTNNNFIFDYNTKSNRKLIKKPTPSVMVPNTTKSYISSSSNYSQYKKQPINMNKIWNSKNTVNIGSISSLSNFTDNQSDIGHSQPIMPKPKIKLELNNINFSKDSCSVNNSHDVQIINEFNNNAFTDFSINSKNDRSEVQRTFDNVPPKNYIVMEDDFRKELSIIPERKERSYAKFLTTNNNKKKDNSIFINKDNSKGILPKQINSLQLARYESKRKMERNQSPNKLDKAENFINEYFKAKEYMSSSKKNAENNNEKTDRPEKTDRSEGGKLVDDAMNSLMHAKVDSNISSSKNTMEKLNERNKGSNDKTLQDDNIKVILNYSQEESNSDDDQIIENSAIPMNESSPSFLKEVSVCKDKKGAQNTSLLGSKIENIRNTIKEDFGKKVVNTNVNVVTEGSIEQNQDDFFKNLADSIKDPRLSKFLNSDK